MSKSAGEILRTLRGERSREEVSKETGITVRSLQAYEIGTRTPRDGVKKELADFYGVPVAYIFFR